MLIDFHVHFFPDFLAQRALQTLAQTARGIGPLTDGTLKGTQQYLNAQGVDIGIAQHIATKPTSHKKINDWAAAIQSPRLICFGSVHPQAPDVIEELYRIKELGLKGIKLHPDYQNFMIDDPSLAPVYETMAKLKLPLLIHAGFDPYSPNLVHARPKAIAQVVDSYKDLTLIAAHLGGMEMCDETEEYLVGKDVYFDTAVCSLFCSEPQFSRIIKAHGTDKILFGSDCPWSSPQTELAFLNRADLTPAQKEQILWKNACALLDLPKPDNVQ